MRNSILAVLGAASALTMTSAAEAQGQKMTLEDLLTAACVHAAQNVAEDPRKVDFLSGKLIETTHGITRSKFEKVISVTASLKVGDSKRNVRCDFGRGPGNTLEFVAGQFNGETYTDDDHDPKKVRFKYGIYDLLQPR